MASSSSEDLTCSVCLCLFDDPVIISCGHSFCRKCIGSSLTSQPQCPLCRVDVSRDEFCFISNQFLKSLVQKAKEAGNDKEAAGWFCPEHEEKLKLFCVTDQQLVCLICRDAEKHNNHQFKPINEAAVSLRKELETFEQDLSKRNLAVEQTINKQRAEITTTKEKSQQLMGQIKEKFEAMHRFLRKREDEIKNELKHKENEEVKEMNKNLNALETLLSEGKELQEKVKSALQVTDPERFSKICTENKTMMKAVSSFKPQETNPQLRQSSLSMGPYESHLQFFVWKQMLQIIQSQEEQLSFTSEDLKVSADKRILLPACQQCQDAKKKQYQCNYYQRSMEYKKYTAYGSVYAQQYAEIDVGTRSFWEIKIGNYALKLEKSYSVSGPNGSNQLNFKGRLKKIGIYLNHSSNELHFYDADSMELIHSFTQVLHDSSSSFMSVTIYNSTDEVPVRTSCY